MTPKPLAWITLILTLAFAAAPLVTPPFTGFDGGQLPVPQDSPPIEPAGYAFSIWGLIYLWLIASAAFGLRARPDDPAWTPARAWLSASLVVGVPWLWAAGQSALWASAMIVWMAATAVLAAKAAPWFDRRWLRVPAGIYAGWLTAASFVALGSTVAGYGVLGPVAVAYIGLAALLVTAGFVQDRLDATPSYGLTVAWALIAIVVQNGRDELGLSIIAAAGAAVLAALALRSRRAGVRAAIA